MVGGFLRWQVVRSAPLTEAETQFADAALVILTRSDWQPKSFVQPPLYLYLTALIGEIQFAIGTGAGRLSSPDALKPDEIVGAIRYVNLLLALLTFIPVYGAAARLWQNRAAGAIAAGLLGVSWLAYHATPELLPQTMAGFLAAGSFFFLVKAWQENFRADFGWAGVLAGLATGAAYGAGLLLICLSLVTIAKQPATRRQQLKNWIAGFGGWLAGFTLAVPGWLFSFDKWVAGLASIGRATPDAAGQYLRNALLNDFGTVALFGLALVTAFAVRGAEAQKLGVGLAFPVAYCLTSCFVQHKLDEHDDRHFWGAGATAAALVLCVLLASIVVRRIF
jgi:Dolichyl-phosphate-mannose-protein mannosyltransferase